MTKIKLCIVTTLPETLEAFVVPAAEYLMENGYRITLVCSMTRSFKNKFAGRFNCVDISMARGIDPLTGPLAVWRMIRLFKAERFDIVQYATPNASLYASLAAFLTSVPGRLYCQWGIRFVGFQGIRRRIFRSIERITCEFSTHISPASQKNLEFAVSQGLYQDEKAQIIGHGGTIGVDLNKFRLSMKARWCRKVRRQLGLGESVVFGFIGSIRREKGVNELLAAFRILVKRCNDVFLIMLGNEVPADPLDPEMRQWSRKCSQVHYCGKIEDVQHYIAAMDILVHPSYREGFSMVLQEAGAMAVPVITTDIPGPSEVIKKGVTGLLVPPMDVFSLSRAMLVLADDEVLRNRMGHAAFKRTRLRFNRERMLNGTLKHRNQVYEETR